jgi:NAD(P)-dependent dehydrogenase (short-subunit alcohol dehydrogenase family)
MANRKKAAGGLKQAERKGEATAAAHRRIQAPIDAKAQAKAKAKPKGGKQEQGAMQAGARAYPEPPFPKQHQRKPGIEARLDPQPMYDAPFYQGSGKLQDMAAIVTGADSGIGRAIAVLYAREGADVAVVYLDEDRDAEETRAAIEAEGRRCILIPGDISDRAFCKAAVERTIQEFGKLDILVNNAAFQQHVEDFADLSPEQFDRTVKTNLYGLYNMSQEAAARMRPGASIVNCGSVTGIRGNKNLLDYSMTKGGIHAFTRSLATHLIPKGVRVNCVAPGPVWTPLNPADQDEEKVSKFGGDTPMKRPAQPEEIAPAFVFFASPQMSSYITGEILPVIGGYGGG